MGTVMMVWVCSLPLKAFDLGCLMLRKFYKACSSCCTNQAILNLEFLVKFGLKFEGPAIAGSPHVPFDDETFPGSLMPFNTPSASTPKLSRPTKPATTEGHGWPPSPPFPQRDHSGATASKWALLIGSRRKP
jgi:hypothetical protein